MSLEHAMTFDFTPLQLVVVTFGGVNYKGRIERCIWETGNSFLYDVNYVNDKGDVCRGEFRGDELSARSGVP